MLPIKALNSQGRGPDSAMVKAILYAADSGARIINISSTGTRYSAALETAVAVRPGQGRAGRRRGGQHGQQRQRRQLSGRVRRRAGRRRDRRQRPAGVVLATPVVRRAGGAGRGRAEHRLGRAPVEACTPASRGRRSPRRTSRAPRPSCGRCGPTSRPRTSPTALRTSADKVSQHRPGLRRRAFSTSPTRWPACAWACRPARRDTRDRPAQPPGDRRRTTRRRRCPTSRAAGTSPKAARAHRSTCRSRCRIPNPQPTVAHFLFLTPEGQANALRPAPRPQFARRRSKPATSCPTPNSRRSSRPTCRCTSNARCTSATTDTRRPARARRRRPGTWPKARPCAPFETWVLILNPNPVPTLAQMHFLREDGSVVDHTELVPAMGRKSVYVNALFTTSGFATQVTADQPIVVERAMYFDNGQGGHDTLATATPGKTWYLAAGASVAGFDTWLLVENPGSAPATVKVVVHDRRRDRSSTSRCSCCRTRAPASTPTRWCPTRRMACASIPISRSWPNAPCISKAAAPATTPPPSPRRRPSGFCPKAAPPARSKSSSPCSILRISPSTCRSTSGRRTAIRPRPSVSASAPTSRLTLDINPSVQDANVALHVTSDRPIVVERVSYFARATGLGATSSTGLTR